MADFREIKNQEMAVKLLSSAIKNNRIGHAYMISGEDAGGMLYLAESFAKALLCEKHDGFSCNECPSCKKTEGRNHPDVIYVTPEKPGLISVSDIRDKVNSDILIKPYTAEHKIYIIEHSEWMNEQAQNALLKTMEEPPSYAVILLLTENEEHFLPTIRSRVVDVTMQPPTDEEKVATPEFLEAKSRIEPLLHEGKETKISDLEDTIAEIAKDKKDVLKALEILLIFFRDVLLYKSTGDTGKILLKDEIYTIKQKNDHISYEGLNNIIKEINNAKIKVTMQVKAELVLELLCIQIKENETW